MNKLARALGVVLGLLLWALIFSALIAGITFFIHSIITLGGILVALPC